MKHRGPRYVRALLAAALLATAVALAFVACGGADVAPASSADVESRSDREDYAEAEDEGQGAWRWSGRRRDCFFVHDNECFSELEAACEAAGCGGDACTHDDSAPATVSCPETE